MINFVSTYNVHIQQEWESVKMLIVTIPRFVFIKVTMFAEKLTQLVVLGGHHGEDLIGDVEVLDISDPMATKHCFKPSSLPRE